jgi:predicted oxidoreductase
VTTTSAVAGSAAEDPEAAVVDVVVVGYGPAGAAAAVAAHDAGARVVVVEASPTGGGNAVHSGGFLFDLPPERAVAHLDALCFGRTPRDVFEAYAAGVHGLGAWLESLGATMAPFEPPPMRFPASFPAWPHFPGGGQIRYAVVAGGEGRRGEALWRVLDEAVAARGIEVRTDTAVHELLLDGGRVNRFARQGRDDDFGREADTLVPLDLTRLYAVPTWPGVAGTTGGPRHDANAQVLRPDGSTVAGLYAAGAVNLVFGHLIDHGGGLTDALVFGRTAGRNAAAPS